MLKSIIGGRLLTLLSPDANTEVGSSETSDEKGQESSTEQQEETSEQEQEDSTEGEENTEDESTEESETDTESTETETQEEQTNEEQSPTVLDKPEDQKLDFHNHPRFQELIKEKNITKQELESLKPLAQRAQAFDQYVQQARITPQRLQSALEYAAVIDNDPAKAYQMIKPIYEKLAAFMGDVLPNDLAAEVAAGTTSAERAQELARLRGQQEHMQMQQQYQGQYAQQQQEQVIQGSIDAWARAKMGIDADLKPKVSGAVDGKWEYLDKTLRSMRFQNPPRNQQEAVAQVEQAYAETNRFFGAFRSKPSVKKTGLKDSKSNSNASQTIKTAADAVRAVMNGKKAHQLKY